ncbi:hypothetical protein [Anaerovorax odorimutans]|uniref:hypothetical protein n=1 Tax=Anaerovorax odorimutans TaxID=109327 RepID=UPI00040F93F8|nr:hypothetical protein [Anaerovorax odorimutans]
MSAKKSDRKITLEDFIKKSTQKYNERKLAVELNVDGDLIPFTRPSEDVLIRYIDGISNAVKFNNEGNYVGQDMEKMFEISKDFVFATCKYLQNKELQESMGALEPTDVVLKVFGIEGTIELAQRVKDAFDLDSEINKKESEIKN